MSNANTPLSMNSYFTKWKGGYKSWKDTPTDLTQNPEKKNIPNTCAAPKGSTAGISFNQVSDNYLASDYNTTWYPRNRPLKIWRKSYSRTSGRIPIGTFDNPGATIFRNDLCLNDRECGVTLISQYSTKENNTTTCCHPTRYDSNGNGYNNTFFTKRRAQLIRNGSTLGSKHCNESNKYYSSTSGYLKSRCNDFSSKLITARPAFEYSEVKASDGSISHYVDSKGNTITPEEYSKVDFSKYITNCNYNNDEITKCCVNTTYKPCNKKYSTNTAVSSSSRIARLKYDTVTKSAQNQRKVWGPEATSASTYSGRPEAPYITKSKFQPCVSKSVNGDKIRCFKLN